METRKEEQRKPPETHDKKPRRFRIEKLEERIAPACHTNPQGKDVGCPKAK